MNAWESDTEETSGVFTYYFYQKKKNHYFKIWMLHQWRWHLYMSCISPRLISPFLCLSFKNLHFIVIRVLQKEKIKIKNSNVMVLRMEIHQYISSSKPNPYKKKKIENGHSQKLQQSPPIQINFGQVSKASTKFLHP